MHRDTIFQYETMVPDTIKTHSQTSLNITVRRSRQSGVARATCPD